MKQTIPTELIDTQDMGLSIALICCGFDLVELAPERSSRRVVFRFRRTEELSKATDAFWAGKLNVDAKLYWNESKNLKTRLYSLS
jgi:Domain of unknown function (DUF5659)